MEDMSVRRKQKSNSKASVPPAPHHVRANVASNDWGPFKSANRTAEVYFGSPVGGCVLLRHYQGIRGHQDHEAQLYRAGGYAGDEVSGVELRDHDGTFKVKWNGQDWVRALKCPDNMSTPAT